MTADLNWGVDIVAHPIVRERDGLAMSSRNTYLSARRRAKAPACPAPSSGPEMAAAGEGEVARLLAEVEKIITVTIMSVEYAEIVEATSLEPQLRDRSRFAAGPGRQVGATRLIDNALLWA